MTNRRAIHSADTSEAKTFTHHASTTSRLAIATPSTSQSSKNHTMGVAMPRSSVKGCSSFWNLNRDLSGGGADTTSVGGGEGVRIQTPAARRRTQHYTLIHGAHIGNCVKQSPH